MLIGHLKETYFKQVGYPEWYNGARDQKGSKNYANLSVATEKNANTGDNNGKLGKSVENSSKISRLIE